VEFDAKLKRFEVRLEQLQPFLAAVSGGVDSRFLLHTALRLKLRCEAVLFLGPHQSAAEQERGRAWLDASGARIHQVPFDPLEGDEPGADPRERCYRCKSRLFAKARALADARGLPRLVDGTQAGDLVEHRPGLRALEEAGVISPLAEAGLEKEEIRILARRFGMDRPDQPARACLLTRFPYGYRPSAEELGKVGRAEEALTVLGLAHFRLRFIGRAGYILHVGEREREPYFRKAEEVSACLAEAGFPGVPVEVVRTLSGFFDRREGEG
jgi:pyridinium-3,5-biscarboxylic acid mononucleotide sulfurtransferase